MNRSAAERTVPPLPAGVYGFMVGAADSGERLDRFLAAREPRLSRTEWRAVIELGGVHMDGRRMRLCGRKLVAGADIKVYLDGCPLTPFRLAETDLLYRDSYLLALNKPAGIETQPTHARFKGTLYEAVQIYLSEHDPPRVSSVGMVQRLDRDTSGVMIFSIHPRAHKGLTEMFTGRSVRKVYHALVAGVPAQTSGEYRSLLARSRQGNRVRSVSAGGKEAVTAYRVLEGFADGSLLELVPGTGRQHQIRAQCAEAGHPLLGDRRYGGPSQLNGLRFSRHLLHASQLELVHPVTRAELLLEAPFPPDFLAALADLHVASNSLYEPHLPTPRT